MHIAIIGSGKIEGTAAPLFHRRGPRCTEGGRRQQPGSSVYVKKLRRDEARNQLGTPK
jgi:hypothetical protein